MSAHVVVDQIDAAASAALSHLVKLANEGRLFDGNYADRKIDSLIHLADARKVWLEHVPIQAPDVVGFPPPERS